MLPTPQLKTALCAVYDTSVLSSRVIEIAVKPSAVVSIGFSTLAAKAVILVATALGDKFMSSNRFFRCRTKNVVCL